MKYLLTLSPLVYALLLSTYSNAQNAKVKGKDITRVKAATGNNSIGPDTIDAVMSTKGSKMNQTMILPPSPKFEMGDPKYVTVMLNQYKNINNYPELIDIDLYADDVVFIHTNGQVIKGKNQYLNYIRQSRDSLAILKDNFTAYTSLHSIDRDENWVILYGSRKRTNKDGTEHGNDFCILYVFSKDGKLTLIRPYTAATPVH